MSPDHQIQWDESGIIGLSPKGVPRKIRWDKTRKIKAGSGQIILKDSYGLKAYVPNDPRSGDNEKIINAIVWNIARHGESFAVADRVDQRLFLLFVTAVMLVAAVVFAIMGVELAGDPSYRYKMIVALIIMTVSMQCYNLCQKEMMIGFDIYNDSIWLKKIFGAREIPVDEIGNIGMAINIIPINDNNVKYVYAATMVTRDREVLLVNPFGSNPFHTIISCLRWWQRHPGFKDDRDLFPLETVSKVGKTYLFWMIVSAIWLTLAYFFPV